MCGFVGFTVTGATAGDDGGLIKAMADTIIHRGPDDEGFYRDANVELGFRRLSIIDLEHGHQPMTTPDGRYTITFNGEIYNYEQLRGELIAQGVQFRTHSDTETILNGYVAWGKDLLNKLRGMFGFVIYDREENSLFGARDIFGIKPMYHYYQGDLLIFGSELKSFLPHPGFAKKFNEKLLPAYLSFEFIPTDETLFTGVRKLLPGHWFEFKAGKLTTGQYFAINYNIKEDATEAEVVAQIRAALADSVVAHEVADVEVGSFLSSGIDSSYVLNEAAKTHSIRSFSVGYDDPETSELPYSTEFSELIGVKNFASVIDGDDYFGAAAKVQWHMDEPMSNPSAIPLYFVSRAAAEHVKVVLSGEGADELFGGYHNYSEPLVYGKYQKVPLPLRKAAAAVATRFPRIKGRNFLIRGALPLDQRYTRINHVFNQVERDALLKDPSLNFDTADLTRGVFAKAKGLNEISQMQYFDIHVWMVYDILLKADRMSMANSLELRVPFLDREVLKVAMTVPEHLRITPETTKIALRLAAAAELPEKTAKKKKLGFPSPLYRWLREDKYYNQVLEEFTSPRAAQFFNTGYIVALLDDHKAGRVSNMQKIWNIYSFLLWHKQYFPEAVPA